jgi:hypothetical protein
MSDALFLKVGHIVAGQKPGCVWLTRLSLRPGFRPGKGWTVNIYELHDVEIATVGPEHVDDVIVKTGDLMVTASSRARLTHRDGKEIADGPMVDLTPRMPGDSLAIGGESCLIMRLLAPPDATKFRVIVDKPPLASSGSRT